MDCDYLVIGAGVAGVHAAEAIRRNDPSGSVVLVSDEEEPLYNRILLPYFIKGEKTLEQLYLRKREDYERQKISTLWGKRVVAAKPNEATLDDGQTVAFRKTVLAYSGDLRKLAGSGFVHYLRTIADAKRIKDAIYQAQQPLVIGDSFIALEFLGALIKQGKAGRCIVASEHFLGGRFSAQTAGLLEDYLNTHGIEIIRMTKVSETLGTQRFEGLKTEDGRVIEGDFCGAGIGLVFGTKLAAALGAKTNKGIVADEYLRSSDNIWTAGDIAEFHDLAFGRRHMLGNWVHGMESGRIAGNNASGQAKPYQTISAYSTQTIGIPVAMAGDTAPNPDNEIITEKTNDGIAEITVRSGRTVGATLVNMPTMIGKVLVAIRSKQPWVS